MEGWSGGVVEGSSDGGMEWWSGSLTLYVHAEAGGKEQLGYPPGPTCCFEAAHLYQAFSQPTSPGRLWISANLSKASAVKCILSRKDSTIVARHEEPGIIRK
jgi:hypothetical protein